MTNPKPRDPNRTYEHDPSCDDDGWNHFGPCIVDNPTEAAPRPPVWAIRMALPDGHVDTFELAAVDAAAALALMADYEPARTIVAVEQVRP